MNIDSIPLKVIVLVGCLSICAKDYLKLREGDILLLDNQINNPFTVKVCDLEKYLVRPGFFNKSKAVLIENKL